MGILIDIITILVMSLFIFIGYKKGLIKVALSFVAVIASIIIALILYRPVANFIVKNTELDNRISNGIYNRIKDVDFANISKEDKEKNPILKLSQQYIDEALERSKDNTATYVADSLTQTIVEGIAFIGLVIALRIALIALNLLSGFVASLPIISQFNKSGGILYGIIEGLVIVNVAFAILFILNSTISNGKIEKIIDQSKLGKLIYNNNIIVNTIIK